MSHDVGAIVLNHLQAHKDSPRNLEQVLYGGDPSLILAAADLDLAGPLHELAGVSIVLFDYSVPGFTSLDGQTVKLRDLSSSPTFPCLLIAASPAGSEQLSKCRDWWTDTGASPAPPLETAGLDATVERIGVIVLRSLLGRTLEANRHAVKSSIDLHDQIVALRECNEEANALISDLRASSNLTESSLSLVCEPSEDYWTPEGDDVGRLFQFPHRVRGLSALDLHFRRQSDSVGWLSVRLIGMENDRVLGSWRAPYEQLNGWVPFRFPTALSAQWHFLKLQLRWQTQVGKPPAISLSGQYVQMGGVGAVDAPMNAVRLPAMRFYKSSPGLGQTALYWCGLE